MDIWSGPEFEVETFLKAATFWKVVFKKVGPNTRNPNWNCINIRLESQVELNKAMRLLQDAKIIWKLLPGPYNSPEESLRIRTNRFKQGLEKTDRTLLNTETQILTKEDWDITSIFNYTYALAPM